MSFAVKFKDRPISTSESPQTTGVRQLYAGKEYFLLKIEKTLSERSCAKSRYRTILYAIQTLGFGLLTPTFWTYFSRSWNGKKHATYYFSKENLTSELHTQENLQRNALISSIQKENALCPYNLELRQYSPYIRNDTEALIEALKVDHQSAKHLNICLKANKPFIKECLQKGVLPAFLQHINKSVFQDRAFVLELIALNNLSFKYFPAELQDDAEFAEASLKKNCLSYPYFSPRLKKRNDFALIFLRAKPLIHIFQLPKELTSDKICMLQAVEYNGLVLNGVAEELKNDNELVNKAMDQNIEAYFHASRSIQNEVSFAKRYITQKPQNLNQLATPLIKNAEIQGIVKQAPNGMSILGNALVHILHTD